MSDDEVLGEELVELDPDGADDELEGAEVVDVLLPEEPDVVVAPASPPSEPHPVRTARARTGTLARSAIDRFMRPDPRGSPTSLQGDEQTGRRGRAATHG